jgi:hypothetical protein
VVFNELDAFTAPCFTVTGTVLAVEPGSSYHLFFHKSQDNAVPLHVDIPRTGRRGFDLPSDDSVQEYWKFFYECFLSPSVHGLLL